LFTTSDEEWYAKFSLKSCPLIAVQIMIFGVVFLEDGINTYITVVMKVETDITSKAVNLI
jgi:hypothetical protein